MSGFSLIGVNLSGAEYDPGGTIEGTNYTYPTDAEIDYYASKGMTVIRLPFLLERVEPVPGGPLSTIELGYIDNVVDYAASKGIDVILDPHDYGTEYGTVIGTTSASNATFANFWGELAGHFASTSNVLFGLMNEPNAVAPTQWLASANAAIAAIRAAGATTQQILVPGTDWDGADTWVSSGNAQVLGSGIVDPSHNFAFEVHQYLDADGSGTSSTVVSTAIGVERLTAITQWAEATGNKLFLGEFGVASDPTSLTAMNNMLAYMAQHTDVWEGGTYWAAGPWLGNYMYSIEPTNGVDAPQMGVLAQYVQTTIETSGSTSLTEFGNHYYLINAAGTGPELEYAGAPVVAGTLGGWTPIGAEQTSGGYEVALKVTGVDEYTVWNTDSNGNYVSQATGAVSGTSTALESIETSFHQDLNGDGVIGIPTTVIEAFGSTKLVEAGSNYYLEGVSSGTGPELQFGSAAVAGTFSGWTPIGAEQTSGGYEVAWKVTGADDYTIWNTDSSGNYVSQATGAVSGTSTALESIETSFHQDLNGDGVIGIPTTVIESFGSTKLVEVGSNYYLEGVSSGNGPELQFGSAAVAGTFSGWTPIGAEQTSGGYEVAWKVTGADDYTIWNTDSSGNYVSQATGAVSGTSTALESIETVFNQDLNGDGVIGPAVPGKATLELSAANSDNVTFASSTGTLKLDNPATFTGQVVGFAGDGTLAGSDHIDLLNLAFSNVVQTDSTYSSSTDMLSVSNGTTVDLLHFIGSYSQANFEFASDKNGGTIVYDPPISINQTATNGPDGTTIVTGNSIIEGNQALNSPVVVNSGATLTLDHATGGSAITNNGTINVTNNSTVNLFAGAEPDNFVFAPKFGQATISHFTPDSDSLQIDHAIFASLDALFAATHDDSHGNAVVTDAAHDTITIENVTTAQLFAHQGNFHLV